MAKQTTTPKAKVPTTTKAPTKPRGKVFDPNAKIVVVAGDDARRLVEPQAPWRAVRAMRAHPTVGKYLAAFGAECDKAPLPGRGGQPGATQAMALLRWLVNEKAVIVD
jgi:hypothetical protein